MEEESSAEIRTVQMEQERERRRLRDRQRRQSMTVEQRERHLARRRRNYQLRRLKAETPMSAVEMVVVDEHLGLKDGGFLPIGQENLNSHCPESVCQETLCLKSDNVATTLRLSRIRCLARSLSYSGGVVGGSCVNVTDATSNSNADTTLQFEDDDTSRLLAGVRLNRVKRLARGLSTANNETNGEIRQGEQDLRREESRMANSDKPMFGKPTLAGNEDKTTL